MNITADLHVTRTIFNKLQPLMEDDVMPATTEDLDATGVVKIPTLDGELKIQVFWGRGE